MHFFDKFKKRGKKFGILNIFSYLCDVICPCGFYSRSMMDKQINNLTKTISV